MGFLFVVFFIFLAPSPSLRIASLPLHARSSPSARGRAAHTRRVPPVSCETGSSCAEMRVSRGFWYCFDGFGVSLALGFCLVGWLLSFCPYRHSQPPGPTGGGCSQAMEQRLLYMVFCRPTCCCPRTDGKVVLAAHEFQKLLCITVVFSQGNLPC